VRPDVAVVLSGGGMNGVLMELGFCSGFTLVTYQEVDGCSPEPDLQLCKPGHQVTVTRVRNGTDVPLGHGVK
jgi:hypothetical protein